VLEHNITTMAASLPGVRCRPHVKAHKCTELAKMQRAAGHTAFTCATIREVEGMAAAGLGDDLLLANEVLDARRLGALDARVTVAVDSLETIDAAVAGGVREVLIDVNVGLPRCGCAPENAGALADAARSLEVKLDIPGFDPDVTADVVVLQPTGLLRAGVIDVGQFALFPSADADGGDARGSIALDPVPLCLGAPFGGLVSAAIPRQKLQEVRLELRTHVEVTAVSGKNEDITLWTGRAAAEGEFGGDETATAFAGELPARWLPTVRLPHSRADGRFHVILAKAWAPDTHLVRDVAICSTTEL
jgi:hypothetical protein